MAIAAVLFVSFIALFGIMPQITNHHTLREQEAASRELFVENARFSNRDYIYIPPARKSAVLDADGIAQRSADGMQMTKRDRSRKIYRSQSQLQVKQEAAPIFTPPAPAAEPEPIPAPEPPAMPAVYVQSSETTLEAPRQIPGGDLVPEPPAPAAAPLMPPASPLAPVAPALIEPMAAPASVEPIQPIAPVESTVTAAEEAPLAAPANERDETIEKVEQAIYEIENLPESAKSTIEVTAEDGVLTLRGHVDQMQEKNLIGRIAQLAAGEDVSIDNQIHAADAPVTAV